MRVLFVSDNLVNGGAERQLALLVTSLPTSHQTAVLSLDGGPYLDVLRERGVSVEVFPRRYRYDVSPAVKIWTAARDFGPDVVHSWGSMTSWAMLPFCRLRRIPLIGVIRNARPPRQRHAMRPRGTSFEDLVVANSRAGLVVRGVSEERGRVVYNGFDTSRLASIPRRTEPSSFPLVTTVVMTARMFPEKDWSMLFRAARKLAAAEGGRWHFVAVGHGPDRERLMREAADLVSGGVLVFPPAGIEVLPLVASSDIGVLLTNVRIHAEGCSNSIMEYMACGLPVVCTDCGGNPELVDEGRTGHLVPSADDETLVTKLRELRDDPERARSMGDEGALRLREAFSVQAMVDAYVSIYESAFGLPAGHVARPR